ncbi:eisosome protein SEG2 [Cucumis melo var. makuwa]|uniref:Eisosome protein SEG2 n=1 Tax=Cucumis melo var. makuwa TaxID=1194695 RepID=A0A5A7T4Q3_CUCMM|nr:eisosome protein SEG2 [Cucumis melo var. makuwa]
MGCFIACFRSSTDVNKRRKQRRRKVLPREQTANAVSQLVQVSPSTVDTASDRSISPILKARDRREEQLNVSTRKRVTFDSNVKTYELEDVEAEAEAGAEGDAFLGKDGNKEEKDLAEIPQSQCKSYSGEGSTVSSISSYPPNHSCLSVCGCPEKTEPQIGVRRTTRDRNACVHSVLKPVENISQWKAVKVKDKHPSNPPSYKENLALNGGARSSLTEPSFKKSSFGYKSKSCQPKSSDQDIAVDASLSNWLSSSEFTPPSKISTGISVLPTPESQGSNSPKSEEDRPILGALTMEELKQFSTTTSPRRSPNRSANDIPIIGTVGTYWSHSDSVEDSGLASSFKRVPNTSSNFRGMRVK